MKSVALGELVAPAQVKRAGRTEYPVLSMTMHDGLVAQTARFKKRIASVDTSDYKVVRRGQLVVGFPINEGVLDFQLLHDAAVVSPAYGIWDLRDESLVDRAYLKRFLKSPRAIEYYVGKMKGSTARRRSLPPAEFNAMPIPLPPVAEQRRIAAILDHADALRTKRRQVLTHLDSLTQSIFRDMFGEPDDNRMPLGEVADFFGGASLPAGEVFADQPGGVLLMKVSDMNSVGNEDEIRTTALWTARPTPRSATVGPGAVVLPKRGASIATNKKRLTTRPTGLDPNLMGVQPRPESLTSRYLHEWFKSFDLSTITSGSTVPQLNKQDLAPLMIPIPSLDVQHDFAERVEAIHENGAAVHRAAAADDQLFASLQSRAFRGEL